MHFITLIIFVLATYVHQASDGTSYVITSEPTSFDTNSTVSMTTISESNPSMVSPTETVDTTGIPLEDHSTLFVLQEDGGAADQEVYLSVNVFSSKVLGTLVFCPLLLFYVDIQVTRRSNCLQGKNNTQLPYSVIGT